MYYRGLNKKGKEYAGCFVEDSAHMVCSHQPVALRSRRNLPATGDCRSFREYTDSGENRRLDQKCRCKRVSAKSGDKAKRQKMLHLDVQGLRNKLMKPLRPLWVTPDRSGDSITVDSELHYPVICCTASRRVRGPEVSKDSYIQGAADDSESWAHAITPRLFWEHKELLMSTAEEDLPALVQKLNADSPVPIGFKATLIAPTQTIYIGTLGAVDANFFDGIIICSDCADHEDDETREEQAAMSRKILKLHCGSGKLGSRALRNQLPRVPPFMAGLRSGTNAPNLLFACQSGKDLSAGVALAVLCVYFDDCGKFLDSQLTKPTQR